MTSFWCRQGPPSPLLGMSSTRIGLPFSPSPTTAQTEGLTDEVEDRPFNPTLTSSSPDPRDPFGWDHPNHTVVPPPSQPLHTSNNPQPIFIGDTPNLHQISNADCPPFAHPSRLSCQIGREVKLVCTAAGPPHDDHATLLTSQGQSLKCRLRHPEEPLPSCPIFQVTARICSESEVEQTGDIIPFPDATDLRHAEAAITLMYNHQLM